MRARSFFLVLPGPRALSLAVVVALAGLGTAGCVMTLPEKVALTPEAANVEVLSEPPNLETYEPAGEVRAHVMGRETEHALRQGMNELRNQAAAKGATFVAVDDVSAQSAWDFSGRTVVTILGTAYRTK
jgi:hypothetical protein